MESVLITVYLIIAIAMIAVILLQRSEGGGLGMGSSNSNGLVTVRGSANLLTRTTAILATLFMSTAIGLTILSEVDRGTRSILDRAADGVGEGVEAPTTVLDALNNLQNEMGGGAGLPVPEGGAPAGTVTPAPASDPALAIPSIDDLGGGAGVVEAPPDDETPAGGEPAADETPAAPVN